MTMMKTDEASEMRREASELLKLLSAGTDRPRYAMGQRVSVAMRITRVGDVGNQFRIEVLCHAHGSVDGGWSDYSVVLKDNLGKDHKLELDRRGHTLAIEDLPGDIVLNGVRIVPTKSVVQLMKRQQLAAARTDVGELFTETTAELQSADGRVTATVTCSAGGGLNVRFIAVHAPDLVGVHVSLRFFTNEGKELRGDVQLWPADERPDELAAVWMGNQTAFTLAPNLDRPALAQKVNLSFEFDVYPNQEEARD
jgi:hypothetical protein